MEKRKYVQEWFLAIESGHLSSVEKCRKDISDIDCRGTYVLNNREHHNVTGLIIGAHMGNKDIVRWLLHAGADVNAKTDLGWRPVHFAAKRGHVATIDMLCSNGAEVDPSTLDNETPLSLALQSHMRDTVRKLITLGARIHNMNEGLICHYVHRGILPPEIAARSRTVTSDSLDSRIRPQIWNSSTPHRSCSPANTSSVTGEHAFQSELNFDVMNSSHVLINKLQCQSTAYDLELARRKRELIKRLPPIPGLKHNDAQLLIQQTQRLSRADLPVDQRLDALFKIVNALPLKNLATGFQGDGSVCAASEPYLRLFEACVCESHCPLALAVQLSRLSVLMVALGGCRAVELNGSASNEVADPPSTSVAGYVSKLLRKLVIKNNSQYRSGILAHLSRILCDTNRVDVCSAHQKATKFSLNVLVYAMSILANLVRLGGSVDQPANVARLARFIGLIGRCLVETPVSEASDSCSTRFSDFADILVGWCVDPVSVSRGVSLRVIHFELCFGLSHWWLHFPASSTRSTTKPDKLAPSIINGMREMICHLLEDSESAVYTTLAEFTPTMSTRSQTRNKSSDPTECLISARLFLSVLSSITCGVSLHVTTFDIKHVLRFSSQELCEWVERLLRLIKSTHSCLRSSWPHNQAVWHSSHLPTVSNSRLSFSILDGIECSVFDLLTCFLLSADCHPTVVQLVTVYLNTRLIDLACLPVSAATLRSLLNLIHRILTSAADHSHFSGVLNAYFGPHSMLHSYKTSFKCDRDQEPPSHMILRTLLHLTEISGLHDGLTDVAFSDLTQSLQFLKCRDLNDSPNVVALSSCEALGLFSFALLSTLMKRYDPENRLLLRRRLLVVLEKHDISVWEHLPTRLRIAIAATLNETTFISSLSPGQLAYLLAVFFNPHSSCLLECALFATFVKHSLDQCVLEESLRVDLLCRLCGLAYALLRSSNATQPDSIHAIGLCTDALKVHAFKSQIYQRNRQLVPLLTRVALLAVSHISSRINLYGSDLMLALGMSRLTVPFCNVPPSMLMWYSRQRPDHSVTSLASSRSRKAYPAPNSSGLIVSDSAFPSLPAVAGVLGILTRGAPYTTNQRFSRLKLLQDPMEWIRRLSHLISPIPTDSLLLPRSKPIDECIGSVLWYAAWTVVDYKLKVAPWANPLNMLLALESALRAFLQHAPIIPSGSSGSLHANISSNFYNASINALTCQSWSRQLKQSQLLVSFLGCLERVIANAIKGFAHALPLPVPPACAFFAANETTCSQWFGRVRSMLMRLAADWPLVPNANESLSVESSATVVQHAYQLLSFAMATKGSALNIWEISSGLSDEVLILTATSLRNLSAWEELQALSDWNSRSLESCTNSFNPFGWLSGVAALTRGHWDEGVKLLRAFITDWILLKRSSTPQNYTASLNGRSEAGVMYAVQVLLQCYLDEGDFTSASELHTSMTAVLDPTTTDLQSSQTSLQVNWTRFNCLSKLSNWSDSTSIPDQQPREKLTSLSRWSGRALNSKLDTLLTDATFSFLTQSKLSQFCSDRLSDLVTLIRQTSAAMFASSCSTVSFSSESSVAGDRALCSWLVQADMLLNSPSQEREDSVLAEFSANTIRESCWLHLLGHSANQRSRINASLQACQWACAHQSPQLCQRLMSRECQQLALLKGDADEPTLQSLHNAVRTVTFCKTDKISQIQRLRLSDCLAQLLWSLNDEDYSSRCNNKLAALDVLARGLRTVLLEEVTQNSRQHAARCRVAAEVALRLFEWLEETVPESSDSWAVLVHRQASTQISSSELMNTSTIAHNLHFFSRLVNEPWANGLPLVPSDELLPHASGRPHTTAMTNHTAWSSRLMMIATRLSPMGSSSQAWLRMADWCFSRGQSLVEGIQITARKLLGQPYRPEQTMNVGGTSKISPIDLLQPDERESAYSLVQNLVSTTRNVDSTNDAPTSKDFVDNCLSLLLAALATFLVLDPPVADPALDEISTPTVSKPLPNLHLSSLCPDDKVDEHQMMDLLMEHLCTTVPNLLSPATLPVEVIRSLHCLVIILTQRQYSLHTSAAQAYATFLTVAEQYSSPANSAALLEGPISKLDTTTATLKLLDLLSSPSRALRSLTAGFLMHGGPAIAHSSLNLTDPTCQLAHDHLSAAHQQRPSSNRVSPRTGSTLGGPSIWETCLPQVLVRLSLPDMAIRDCLVALLTRLIRTDTTSADYRGRGFTPSSRRFATHLVFPAIVAALDSSANVTQTRTDTTVSTTKCSNAPLSTAIPAPSATSVGTVNAAFSQIINALQSAGFTDLVQQVKVFVSELQRSTLLWEELWYGALSQHVDELAKKIALLESEVKRSLHFVDDGVTVVSDDAHQTSNKENYVSHNAVPSHRAESKSDEDLASHERPCASDRVDPSQWATNSSELQNTLAIQHVSIMQPTLNLLSELSSLSLDVQPETPHEEWFQRTFGPMISELRDSLLNPIDFTDTKSPLILLRQLINHFQTICHSPGPTRLHALHKTSDRLAPTTTRSSAGNVIYLSLHHLSPRLTRMHFGGRDAVRDCMGLPLPGQVDLQSVSLSSRVAILPTKTRPKRLLFRAQNGRVFSYLLKGLEDLRLDDRIMRLFDLVNVAIADHTHGDSVRINQMCARTYTVTPLGVRAGLIQMVQGAVPLFSLYKRWQMRTNKAVGDASTSQSPNRPIVVPRPGELFHSRLKELLLASSLPYQPQARNTWPLETLKAVLHSLAADTPADLLSRELWASNPSSAQWWHTARTFARSSGLMSSLGYLVGLGDRHLDNLLIDLTTGHLIHIDYNVCFDKGRSLRVAERVPFRLTRILRHPLGPLAQDRLVRGTFRVAAEESLHVVRGVLDPILIQLKAFLIDPLVEWQTKKSFGTMNSSISVTDFTHIAAYRGGGSSATGYHHVASNVRKLHRLEAELRLYTGLVTTRVVELCHTRSLTDASTVLHQMVSRLRVWEQWYEAESQAASVERAYGLLTTTSTNDMDSAERRCCAFEAATKNVDQLVNDLRSKLGTWKSTVLTYSEWFQRLMNPTWLPSLIMPHIETMPDLANALSQYYSVARIYLAYPSLTPNQPIWTDPVTSIHSMLDSLFHQLPVTESSLDSCLTCIHSVSDKSRLPTVDQAMTLDFVKVIRENQSLIGALQDGDSETGVSDMHTALRPEVDNLRLFLYDQESFGVIAYCWALMCHLPNVVANVLSLETDPQSWQQSLDPSHVVQIRESGNSLDQLLMYCECLVSLFDVLHHPQSGMVRFTAGYEADSRREMAFLFAVRDACACLCRLHVNLTKLLLPEAMDSVISATGPLAEDFSTFVLRTLTESSSNCLPNAIGLFLKDRTNVSVSDARLHQVLIAVHLALTNSAAQMEEISQRIRDCLAAAPAWYYVDVIAQATSTMLTRANGWREGATALWGWEASVGGTEPDEIRLSCSWSDEVYTSGLMTFASILEENRAHWNALQHNTADAKQEVVLTPFANAINRYIGRLSSRLAMASLVGLTSARLCCALIEDTGISVRRLVVENELHTKATGLANALVFHLSMEKLTETASVHLSVSRPPNVQHLRNPASSLIVRLTNRATQVNEHLYETMKREVTERHVMHLSNALAVLHWVHLSSDDSDMMNRVDCDQKIRPQSLPFTSLANALLNIIEVLPPDTDCSNTESTDIPAIVQASKAICYFEKVRLQGIGSCPIYQECRTILMNLKQAVIEKNAVSAQLTQLDHVLLDLKTRHQLHWPAHNWLSSACCVDDTMKQSNLNDQMMLDMHKTSVRAQGCLNELFHTRAVLQCVSDSDSLNTKKDTTTTTPVVIATRQAHKRANRHNQNKLTTGGSLTTVSSTPQDDSALSTHKPSALVATFRSALTTLQCERLSEIRQLVKVLSRYEMARLRLVYSDKNACGVESVGPWTLWLDKHQTWTTNVMQFLKKLSKFAVELGLTSFPPETFGRKHFQTNLQTADHLREEMEMVSSLLTECSHINERLWMDLLWPLVTTIRSTVDSDRSWVCVIEKVLQKMETYLRQASGGIVPRSVSPTHPTSVNPSSCSSHNDSSPRSFQSAQSSFGVVNPVISAHALEIWHRIQDRLKGCDPLIVQSVVPNQQVSSTDTHVTHMSVTDQIDACIHAATDIDNLALMYEGWTAWV